MHIHFGQRSGGKGLLFIPHAHIMHIAACQQQQACAQRLRPVRRRSKLVVRNVRDLRRRLAASIGAARICGRRRIRDGGEGLVIAFIRPVTAHDQGALMRPVPVAADRVTPQARVVDLVRSAVVPALVEADAACEQAQRPVGMLDQREAGARMHVRVHIYRPALPRSFLDVAVRAHQGSGDFPAPWAAPALGKHALRVGVLPAVRGAYFERICGRLGDAEADHAANRARSIEVAGAAADQLHAAQGKLRLLLPVDPPAHRIVHRDIVFGHQRAARRRRAKPAQADALRRRIRHQRTGAAEQLHARQLPQLVVHGYGGRALQCRLRKLPRDRGALQLAQGRAIRRNGHLLDGCGGSQLQGHGVDTVRPRLILSDNRSRLRKPFCFHGETAWGVARKHCTAIGIAGAQPSSRRVLDLRARDR